MRITNDHGGFRNVTFEVIGKDAYGTLKNESGVHRLVRISPFNAKQMRHTSFSLVEVIPKFEKVQEADIPPSEVRVELSKAGGPGGQNVNKRETAVRLVHIPTNIQSMLPPSVLRLKTKKKPLPYLKANSIKRRKKIRRKKLRGWLSAVPLTLNGAIKFAHTSCIHIKWSKIIGQMLKFIMSKRFLKEILMSLSKLRKASK
jgi:protein subunit release factor B